MGGALTNSNVLTHLQKVKESQRQAQSSRSGGLTSIINRIDESNKIAQGNLSTAFEDLDSLMAKAAEMVKLADSIGSKIAHLKESDMPKEVADFRSNLLTLGIQDPVTKYSIL